MDNIEYKRYCLEKYEDVTGVAIPRLELQRNHGWLMVFSNLFMKKVYEEECQAIACSI